MKNLQQNLLRRAGIFGTICLLAVSLSSCLKNNNDDYVAPSIALLSVINASPGSPSLDFYLDQNRANVYPFGFGNGLDYLQAYSGTRKATFVTAGTTTPYLTDTLTLEKEKYYSLFLANVSGHQESILTMDSISKPANGKAFVRFVNLSPNAGAVDLGIKNGAVIIDNKIFKSISSFKEIDATTGYDLEIRKAGTTTVLASLPKVPFSAGSVYTVWLQGLTDATDATKPAIGVQKNVYFY